MYCPHCNVYIEQEDVLGFSFSDSDSYSYDEDQMSDSDDYAMPEPRSPKKRSRSEAKLSNSSDDDRPRKKLSPVPSSDDAMLVDDAWVSLTNLNWQPKTSSVDLRGTNYFNKNF